MASDVTLDQDLVIVDGKWTKLRTWDLMLDAASRRQTAAGERRALVHDVGDRLTINYHGDYPNGVAIDGSTAMDSLYVRGPAGFATRVVTPTVVLGDPAPPVEAVPGGPPPGGGEFGLDVGAAIRGLQERVAQLEQRLAQLGG
jgi:hypothetical protein